MLYNRFVKEIEELDFKKVYDEEYLYRDRLEYLQAFWQEKNHILIVGITYDTNKLNDATLYCNWESLDPKYYLFQASSSPIADSDIRAYEISLLNKNITNYIKDAERHGRFIKPWMQTPHIWLVNLAEENYLNGMHDWGYYDEINQRKYSQIRERIG